jgi:hypothetical protein
MEIAATGDGWPVIGHLDDGHQIGSNYLAGPAGNAILAVVGYNSRFLLV